MQGQIANLLAAAASNPNGPGVLNSTDPDPTALALASAWGNRTGGLAQMSAYFAGYNGAIDLNAVETYVKSQKQFQPASQGGNGEVFATYLQNVQNAVASTDLTYTTLPSSGSSGSVYQAGTSQSIQVASNGTATLVSQTACSLGNNSFTVVSSSGAVLLSITPSDISSISYTGANIQVLTKTGGASLNFNISNGTCSYSTSGQNYSFGSDPVNVTGMQLQLTTSQTSLGNIGTDYTIGSNGSLGNGLSCFIGNTQQNAISGVGTISGVAGQLESDVNTDLSVPAQSSVVDNQYILSLDVAPMGSGFAGFASGGNADTSDVGVAIGGEVITGPGIEVQMPYANDTGLVANLSTGIATDGLQPGQERDLAATENDIDLTAAAAAIAQQVLNAVFPDMSLSDNANGQGSVTDIDPLLVDLTGGGIQVSNWIDNDVYFQSNVNGTTQDTSLHHTSWMESGTGMLVLDPADTAITNITQTVSQYLNLSGNAAAVGHYADGLAALAAMAVSGATVFDAATSRTDPNTGNSYWSEVMVATGTPGAGGAIAAAQLESLPAAGIASISLAGSGNQGESLAGSAVTNTGTYTTTAGATQAVAAVDLQTDTTGDLTYDQANGSVVINSTPEGGASATTSYVDQAGTAQTLALSGGTLTDDGSAVAQHDGEAYNAVFAEAGDTVTVAAGDTSGYWLSGAAGTTLNASAADGSIMFLASAGTVVEGGHGFNILQETDSAPVTVNLKSDKLQEAIGGAGDATLDAAGTIWNVFLQGGSGNNILIGGEAADALSGGTGDDLIEAGPGGSVIHAGSGNDVIYGGSGTTTTGSTTTANSDVIYGGAGNDIVVLGTNSSAVYAGTGAMTVIGNDTQDVGSSSTKAFSEVVFSGSYADYTLSHNSDGSITITDDTPDQNGPVTLENVTDVSFSDLGDVPLADTAGLPVDDTIDVTGTAPYVIAASTLLANDIDYAGSALSLQGLESSTGAMIAAGGSGAVNGGTAALSSNGQTIIFTPTPGFTGIMSFNYYVENASGQSNSVQEYNGSNVATGTSAEMSATVTLLTPSEPTDPGLTSEWYLQAADVLPAWQEGFTGAGVSVGVFDPSGNVDFTNPDLTQNEGGEFDAQSTPGIGQIGTHATLVAGVIAAADNGEGDVGVAYNATLSSEAIPSPTGPATSYDQLFDWSNYDVVNNSWGTTSSPYADSVALGVIPTVLFQNAALSGRNGLGTAYARQRPTLPY